MSSSLVNAVAFLALAACANLLAAQPAQLVQLKADMLDGTRIVLRKAGCSVDVPPGGWRWMTYEGNTSQNYLCSNSRSGELYLVSVGQLHGEFTDHQPKSLIDNASRAIAARGGKVENDKYDWIELPGAKKCVRVTFTETDSAGKKTLAVIYIAETIDTMTLKLQFTGPVAAEPESFKQMAHSLKGLK